LHIIQYAGIARKERGKRERGKREEGRKEREEREAANMKKKVIIL
jgi:hypothetical protein